MSVIFLLLCFVLHLLVHAAADPIPKDWSSKVTHYNALFAENDDGDINADGYPGIYTPLIGNGYLSHSKGVRSDTYFVSGVFNGETTSPSHRARIPATFAVTIDNTTTTGTLLDMKEGTFLRRGNLTNEGDWYELRWYAHMKFEHLYVMELDIHFAEKSNTDNFTIHFTNNGGKESSDIDFKLQNAGVSGDFSYIMSCGHTEEPETEDSSSITVCMANSDISEPFTVSRANSKKTFSYFTVIYTSLDVGTDDVESHTWRQFNAVTELTQSALRSYHVESWNTLWESGVEIISDKRGDIAFAVNASWFAIFSSVRHDWPYGLAPGGLTNYYNGHSFWDTETWMYPPILLLNPSIAKSLVQYRYDRLNGAYSKAKSYSPPYEGAMFPWESAFTGVETCPEWAATGLREQHISADISLSVWQFYSVTRDAEWLEEIGMPILKGVADFLLSRAEYDDNGHAHIRDVIPPDEYVDNVDDSVYTNYAAAEALRFALKGAEAVEMHLARADEYLELANALVILYDKDLAIHPEYHGYNGSTIKQADVVLLHYPWGLNMDTSVQQSDLQYYSSRSDENGPAMTWSMHAIGFKDLGMYREAAQYFNMSFQDNMQDPFYVWTETPNGNAGNFITGAGGFLQAVMFGYPGIRVEDERLLLLNPMCPQGTEGVKLRGLWYLGSRMDITFRCQITSPPTCKDHLVEEISVYTLSTATNFSLRIVKYDSAGKVEYAMPLSDLASVSLALPCDIELSGSMLAIIATKV